MFPTNMVNNSPSPENAKKTRWGCLAFLVIPTLLFAAARVHDMRWERQPLSVHLRSVFKESGFQIPDYVSEIDGAKGFVDFQGDYSALVSFTVRPEDTERFMHLPPELWKDPSTFKPLSKEGYFHDLKIPAGTYMIEEWDGPSEYMCKYAVDRASNRVYFYRASW